MPYTASKRTGKSLRASCAWPTSAAARDVLQLPDSAEPIAFTPLGYPADQPGTKERKLLSALVRYEHW